MKRNKLFIAMAAFALFLAALACAGGGPPAITDVVTAKSLDESYRPVDPTSSYQPEDVISVSVHVENLVVGSTVKVQYKLNGELYEEFSLAADEAGSGYYGFTLAPNEYGHVPGSYTVDVYLDGTLVKTVAFTIEGDTKAEILGIVLAKGLAEDSAPIDPTNTFLPSEVVHVSVEIRNMVAGSEIQLVYTYEDGQSVEQTSTIDVTGSGYLGFTFAPSADGHPSGEYTLEVSLDGEPYPKPVTFTVTE
ncbi:MAG: hypothetical protein JW730_07840 [Anaerolineales bacterium]|nr:hypothetical protein [Anaerolineales bacterium]